MTGNCSELANSLPPDLVAETGGGIIVIYCYAVLVVLATLGLYIKYVVTCRIRILSVSYTHLTLPTILRV